MGSSCLRLRLLHPDWWADQTKWPFANVQMHLADHDASYDLITIKINVRLILSVSLLIHKFSHAPRARIVHGHCQRFAEHLSRDPCNRTTVVQLEGRERSYDCSEIHWFRMWTFWVAHAELIFESETSRRWIDQTGIRLTVTHNTTQHHLFIIQ